MEYSLPMQPRTESSTPALEPAGEDEYDPNRPAFLGTMVESHRIVPPRRKTSQHAPLENGLTSGALGGHETMTPVQTGSTCGASGHMDVNHDPFDTIKVRSAQDPASENSSSTKDRRKFHLTERGSAPNRTIPALSLRSDRVSEDGEVTETIPQPAQSSSRPGLTAEVEHFLKEFKPELGVEPRNGHSASGTTATHHTSKHGVTLYQDRSRPLSTMQSHAQWNGNGPSLKDEAREDMLRRRFEAPGGDSHHIRTTKNGRRMDIDETFSGREYIFADTLNPGGGQIDHVRSP